MSKRKGTRLEWRTRRWYEAAGFVVVRAAGSHGPLDLVCLHPYKLEAVQVKSNRWCAPAERATLEALDHAMPRCRDCGDRLGEVVQIMWRDYAHEPQVRAYRAGRWVRLDR
jgi:hypothetical protein